jgi:hypothetical protein
VANAKWVKWAVGISSVAFFTGMIGVINHTNADSTTNSVSNEVVLNDQALSPNQEDTTPSTIQPDPFSERSAVPNTSFHRRMRTHGS